MSLVLLLDWTMEVTKDDSRPNGGMRHRPGIGKLRQLRARVAAELRNCYEVAAVVTYSEVARVGTLNDLVDVEFDFVYGSNLEHGLELARSTCRSLEADTIALVSYSLPSAHQTPSGTDFFLPPIETSLEAARLGAAAIADEGLRLAIILLEVGEEVDVETQRRLDFFIELAQRARASLTVLRPDDELDP